MAGYTTYLDYTAPRGTLVESVTVRKTSDVRTYPSGWNYGLHLGTLGGMDLLRYDNAHETTKGHELHTPTRTDEIAFPGMWSLLVRFYSETVPYWDAIGRAPPDRRPL